MIKNKDMTENEKNWLDTLLSKNFQYRKEVINQINSAKVIRKYTEYYLSLKFEIDNKEPPTEIKVRVPIELRLYKQGQVPTQFLLHFMRGYVSELEVFNADSSKITANLTFTNKDTEIILDPQIMC